MVMLSMVFLIIGADFPICSYTQNQYYPTVFYANDQYYVFWRDYRDYNIDTTITIFGARVTKTGTVLDPGGKLFFKDQVGSGAEIAYDGTNFLGVFRNGC
jgi:hypothetical protein